MKPSSTNVKLAVTVRIKLKRPFCLAELQMYKAERLFTCSSIRSAIEVENFNLLRKCTERAESLTKLQARWLLLENYLSWTLSQKSRLMKFISIILFSISCNGLQYCLFIENIAELPEMSLFFLSVISFIYLRKCLL